MASMFQTKDEKFNELLKCLEPLRENKVPVDNFTQSELLTSCYLPSDKMLKHVRVLTTIPYKDVRDSVLAKAHLGLCPLSDEMNLLHIYQVCQWMKTKAGIAAVIEVQRSEKLKRRSVAKGRTVAESAMIITFNAQLAEYSTELKKAGTALRLHIKYWPVSAFGVATKILDFCRKEGVKCGLYKYVVGLIERKKKSFALREADKLRVVLKEMECFEVPVSSKDGNHRVGEKRKDIESGFGREAETSSKTKNKTQLTREKKFRLYMGKAIIGKCF